MNRSLTIFRTLIIVSLVLALVGSMLDLVATGLVPENLNKAYEDYDPYGESLWVGVGIFALLLLVAGLVGAIALLLLKPWARSLSLWVTVVAIASSAFLGATLYSGPATMVLDFSTTLWGAVLAMAYFSDVKVHFEPAESPTAAVA